MKKTYMKPIMESEVFVTNEYVAACWGVACNTVDANKLEEERFSFLGGIIRAIHDPNECGLSTHQYIIADDEGKVIKMTEHRSTNEVLDCTFYTDDTYQTQLNSLDLKNLGEYKTIYWTSTYKYVKYHHQGNLMVLDNSHPNAS